MIEILRKNAELTVQHAANESGFAFGYDSRSVEWLEKKIERHRVEGAFRDDMVRQHWVSVWGSYLGEAIIQSFGGEWEQREGNWVVAFDETNAASPFNKIAKQMLNGVEDGIAPFYSSIPVLFAHVLKRNAE